ncbi:MAG: hypothetical protein H0W25_13580 [Acidimicrobiia bacterium]|nr:hypothetical protein [Acidimicrobiia bacterium]
MTETSTPIRSTRSTRSARLVQSVLALGLVAGALLGGASAASAETDGFTSQCISVGGYQRGCIDNGYVTWGSGISWRIGGALTDTRNDGWYVTYEAKLDRQLSSDTAWMRVLRAGDFQAHTSSISGYDPTNGAWVRLCATNPSGTKYCMPTRWAADNS